jgi:hypothetical protein
VVWQVLTGNPFVHILLLQDIFNQKGILYSRRDFKRSVELLQQAEELYKAWEASLPTESSSYQDAELKAGMIRSLLSCPHSNPTRRAYTN